jgi:hypothetical protein
MTTTEEILLGMEERLTNRISALHLSTEGNGARLDRMEASLEARFKEQQMEIQEQKIEIQRLAAKVVELEAKAGAPPESAVPKWVSEKLEQQESQLRRSNFIISGIPEVQRESWAATEAAVMRFLHDYFGITSFSIERAHRLGQPFGGRPRRIIVKASFFKEKEAVMRQRARLAKSNIYLDDDLPVSVRERRDALRRLALPVARKENKKLVLSYPFWQARVGAKVFTLEEARTLVEMHSSSQEDGARSDARGKASGANVAPLIPREGSQEASERGSPTPPVVETRASQDLAVGVGSQRDPEGGSPTRPEETPASQGPLPGEGSQETCENGSEVSRREPPPPPLLSLPPTVHPRGAPRRPLGQGQGVGGPLRTQSAVESSPGRKRTATGAIAPPAKRLPTPRRNGRSGTKQQQLLLDDFVEPAARGEEWSEPVGQKPDAADDPFARSDRVEHSPRQQQLGNVPGVHDSATDVPDSDVGGDKDKED